MNGHRLVWHGDPTICSAIFHRSTDIIHEVTHALRSNGQASVQAITRLGCKRLFSNCPLTAQTTARSTAQMLRLSIVRTFGNCLAAKIRPKRLIFRSFPPVHQHHTKPSTSRTPTFSILNVCLIPNLEIRCMEGFECTGRSTQTATGPFRTIW